MPGFAPSTTLVNPYASGAGSPTTITSTQPTVAAPVAVASTPQEAYGGGYHPTPTAASNGSGVGGVGRNTALQLPYNYF